MNQARRRATLAAAWIAAAALAAGCVGPTRKPTRMDPEEEAVVKIREANSLSRNGRLHDAVSTAKKAVDLQPENAGYQNFYGYLCMMAGRSVESEQAFRTALKLDPYLTDAHNNLGALYDQSGRKTEAEEEFRKALADRAYPTPEKVYLNLAILYGSLGRREEALKALRQSVQMNPKFFQAHYELAQLLEKVGQLEEAAREYEVAAPEYDASGEYHYRTGFTYYRLRNEEKARAHLTKVIELSPGSEDAAQAAVLLKLLR